MSTLTKAAIFAARLKTERVAAPEWGGDVLVRELNAGERAKLEDHIAALVKAGKPLDTIRERLVALACVGEDGARLFDDEDAAALSALSGAALARVADAVLDLSGMSDKAAKDAEKN